MEPYFFGSFNKQKGLVEWQQLNKDYGYEYEADTEILGKVSRQIISVIGEKEKYTLRDAERFFREYYYAYPIRLADFYDHTGAEYTCFTEKERENLAIKYDNAIDGLNKGVGYGGQYCYIADSDSNASQEKSITLVIPTSYSRELWRRYPEYLEKIKIRSEEYNKFNKQEGRYSQISPFSAAQNIIIVIGSFDAETINSMKVILGAYELSEVEYALEYFRLHS